MTEEKYYKPCSTCHNTDCVWMGGQDTHKKCEDYQALEQEPCDDCLFKKEWEKIGKLISVLLEKQTEPKTEWIPVSERFPVLRGTYKISDDVLITNGFEIDMGYLVERKGKIFWHYYGSEYEVGIKDEDNDATAWMPLPELYKESEEI